MVNIPWTFSLNRPWSFVKLNLKLWALCSIPIILFFFVWKKYHFWNSWNCCKIVTTTHFDFSPKHFPTVYGRIYDVAMLHSKSCVFCNPCRWAWTQLFTLIITCSSVVSCINKTPNKMNWIFAISKCPNLPLEIWECECECECEFVQNCNGLFTFDIDFSGLI